MTHTMVSGDKRNLQAQPISQKLRGEIIDQFLSVKRKYSVISRQTIFTALAIYQKYILKRTFQKEERQEIMLKKDIQITACIWIAIKILCYEKTIFEKILNLYQVAISKEQIIKTEAQILQTIDFQVPLYHTYASMIFEFNTRCLQTKENSRELVAQCLAFYGAAIKLSSNFVLEERLGKEIVGFLADRRINDSLILWAYKSILRKRNSKKDLLLQDHNKPNSTIQVCE